MGEYAVAGESEHEDILLPALAPYVVSRDRILTCERTVASVRGPRGIGGDARLQLRE